MLPGSKKNRKSCVPEGAVDILIERTTIREFLHTIILKYEALFTFFKTTASCGVRAFFLSCMGGCFYDRGTLQEDDRLGTWNTLCDHSILGD